MLSNGFAYLRDPILRPLQSIECRDAVLDLTDADDPREPAWPEATVIIGNPPFVGGKLMRTNLGDEYVEALRGVYRGRVPGGADLVCYWFEKTRAMVEADKVERVGLLATQGIRGGANRRVLERIKETGDIFLAWSDEEWVVEGAAVHVSLIGFDDGSERVRLLDGKAVTEINPNLTAGIDVTQASALKENLGIAFVGDQKGGPFEIPSGMAKVLLDLPNPDGRTNADVVRPWVNGREFNGRPSMWIIDFNEMPIGEAALYEGPFEYAKQTVLPIRSANRLKIHAERWWIHERPRPEMRQALSGLHRFIATTRHAKYRIFVWLTVGTVPDSALIAFARDDDYFFGVLHSSVHEVWARGLGTQVREVESGFRYTPTTTFETFPFSHPTDDIRDEIGAAAKTLDEYRNSWLNPPGMAEADLRKRTLTNLYNARPSWLALAHERLDRAVYAAYDWRYPLEADEVLARLVELNLSRAVKGEL